MNPLPVFPLPANALSTAPAHHAQGWHFLADLQGVAVDLLGDASRIGHILNESAKAAGAHVLFTHFHHFGENQGVTGVLLLAESHISIHTWPEYGFAAADIFMCGQAAPERALAVLRQAFAPTHEQVQRVLRGNHGMPCNNVP
jgi:S-adenosylmethionine decarboxylase